MDAMGNPVSSGQPDDKKRRNMIIIVVVVILLCCCCSVVSGGAFWLWNNGDSLLQQLQGMLAHWPAV